MAGTWEPGGFPPWITLAAKMALLGTMVVRGADYLVGDSADTARRLSAVESAAPLWAWGLVLVLAGGLGFGSIITRYGRGVLLSHLVGWVCYWTLAVGIVTDVVARSDAAWCTFVPPVMLLSVGGVLAWLACKRSAWEYAPLTTVGIAVSAALAVSSIELDGLRNATILLAVGTVHGLLAVGTASHLRQAKIVETRRGLCD